MKKLAIQILTAMSLTIAALLAFAKGASASDISVTNAVAGQSHVEAARTGAVYFTIINGGATKDALVGMTTDIAETAELHESKNENNIMRMRAVERLELFPGDHLDLRKMGMHVMLVGLKGPLKAGQKIALELQFETSAPIKVEVVVGDQLHLEPGHEPPSAAPEHEDTGQ